MEWNRQRKRAFIISAGLLLLSGLFLVEAQDSEDEEAAAELKIEHPECAFFGSKREALVKGGLTGSARNDNSRSVLTEQVVSLMPAGKAGGPRGAASDSSRVAGPQGAIDRYIFEALQQANVAPAEVTNDYEFIRRVTLDLTGRIPAPERVTSFVADTQSDKRAKLIDELLGKPEWVDKWTMYFGDLFTNTTNNTTTGVNRYVGGRNAFYQWIKNSLAVNKSYKQIASEIISVQGTNSYDPEQGHVNWIVNGQVTNGPIQDAYDQEAANVADTFLGISHLNCVMCHNGRGKLDSLSLWG